MGVDIVAILAITILRVLQGIRAILRRVTLHTRRIATIVRLIVKVFASPPFSMLCLRRTSPSSTVPFTLSSPLAFLHVHVHLVFDLKVKLEHHQ